MEKSGDKEVNISFDELISKLDENISNKFSLDKDT